MLARSLECSSRFIVCRRLSLVCLALPAEQIDYSACVADLQRCSRLQSLVDGRRLHRRIAASALRGDTFLGNLLILMYGSCKNTAESWLVFEESIERRNVFSWNTMAGSLLSNSQPDHTMNLLEKMPQWDVVAWNTVLAANAHLEQMDRLQQNFNLMPERNVIAWNTLITSFSQQALDDFVLEIFANMPQHTVVTWTCMIAAFARRGDLDVASAFFHSMPERNDVSWSALAAAYTEHFLSATAIEIVANKMPQWSSAALSSLIQSLLQCRQLDRAWAVFLTMSHRNEFAWNILLQGLFSSGDVAAAELVLDRMPARDVVACNTSIAAYAMGRQLARAREIFDAMPHSSIASWNAMLDAFARVNAIDDADRTFFRMPGHDSVSWTAMLSVYAQNGQTAPAAALFQWIPSGKTIFAWNCLLHAWSQARAPRAAAAIFDRMPGQDVVSWNTLLAAHSRSGAAGEAVRTFCRMDLEAVEMDDVTLLAVLDSASGIYAAKLLLDELLDRFQSSCVVASALVTACSKCGYLSEAWAAFRNAGHRDTACWSSMISAYALNGHEIRSLMLVRCMLLSGLCPDEAILVIVLSACSHAGLLDTGLGFFRDFGDVSCGLDHYSCVIDLLARVGEIDDAIAVIEAMPFEPGELVWTSILAACAVHGDAATALLAAEKIAGLNPGNGVGYVLLSNLEKSRGNNSY